MSTAIAFGTLAAACSTGGSTSKVASRPTASGADPHTRQALLRIATQFNAEYAANKDGPVYDRWDPNSQALISRANYVKRHVECPTPPGSAVVESATPGPDGYWLVRYSISGIQFVDYWHYLNSRWRFDLARSNPGAVKLYRLSFAAYAKAVGCTLSN